MKKIFSLLVLWLCHIALFAQYGGAGGTFNPVNPDNPEPVGVRYGLHVVAQPEGAGTTNLSYSNEITAGSQTHLYAYPSKDYEFKEWTCDGQVLSTAQDFFFIMPEKDVTVTAVFTFSPENPGNPGANDWNEESRTLIIDDFQAGSLSDAIYQATGGHTGQVKTLIVSGIINNNDLGSLAAFTSMEVIDLSRCYGADTVPAWYFNGNTSLKDFSLPASITTVENNAFANCIALTSLNSYAVVPPALGANAFQNITKNLVVYVPENSVSAYENAPGWKELNIQPLGTKVRALEVDLPEGSEGRYKNLFVELVNQKDEQVMRYLITDAVAYTFKNLRPGTVWNAYVKNAEGQILGSILDIEIGEKNLRVQFESLLEPQTIKAQVFTPNGEEKTDQVVITWLNERGSYLGQGSSISGILPLDDAKVTVRVALSEELLLDYQTPDDVVYIVQSSDNLVKVTLKAVDKITLKGKVVDEETKEGIDGVNVVVGQTIYGRYTKSFKATTDAQGVYVIQGAYEAPTNITASAADYTSQTASYDTLVVANGTASLGDIALKSLKNKTNTRIQVTFQYKLCAENELQDYADSLNVAYYIWNLSQGMQQVTEFNVNGREIVLLEQTNVGDMLLITAISKTNAFAPQNAGCTVDANYQANAAFVILEPGQLSATYVATDAPAVTGILYDATGKFVRSGEFDDNATLLFTNLSSGMYTLVAMSRSSLFNSIYDLSKFADFGLVKGTDYVTNTVYVQDGIIMPTKFAYVPYLDESKLDFMGDKSSFSVNKTTITAGNTLTLTASVDFKDMYVKDISDVKLVVDLDSCNFVGGSVMVGSKVCDEYELSGDQLIIPMSDLSDRIRFCVKPLKARDYAPTASVQFVYNGKQMTKPIGQASFTAEQLSISVPATIDSPIVPVSGTAPARAQVWIYDDNELIGMTMALSNGTWSSQSCELLKPVVNPSDHHIYARIKFKNEKNEEEEIITETRTVHYEEEVIVLDKVEMLNTAHPATSLNLKQYKTVFEFTRAQKRLNPYWYWPDYPEFTFLIYYKQDMPYEPKQVELFVYTSNRKYRILKPTRYDTKKKAYVVTSRFYVDALPISVNVRKVGDPIPPAHKPYVEYVLDPSGYVYEGVPTNRLEGVTATIYYRPVGDTGPGSKWDAEGYGQENPILTDEFGMYAWDVPEGEWKVKFEKTGYEPTESEWLPVPPPQLNVNIPMVQSTPPVVKSAKAYKDGVEIEFDKYMLSSSLTTDNILINCDNEVVPGTIELLNAEGKDENDENQQRYASRVKFIFPEGGVKKDIIYLMVNTNVENYAGLHLEEPYSQELEVELQVKEIVAEPVIAVEYESNKSITVGALLADGSAAKGKSLRIRSLSTEIADIEDVEEDGSLICKLDDNGQAKITVNGLLPGTAAIQYTIEETNAEEQVTILAKGQTVVNVTEKPLTTAYPTASRVSGAAVYRGTLISLSSESDDAKIYYSTTPDGEPTTLYAAPIAINADKVTINAFAKADGFEKSELKTFTYTVLQNKVNLNLADGWTWMSHNVADNQPVKNFPSQVVEIKGQAKGAVRDEKLGWFGNLSELVPSEGYKMKVSGAVDKQIAGDAFNASKGAISLAPGWNWIGYPMNQTMSVEEALVYLPAAEGDQLVGLNGSAEYVTTYQGGKWVGDIANLEPGKSYLLKTSVANDLRYNTSIISKAAALAHGRLDINNTPWSVNIHAYPNVMPMRLQIVREEEQTNDEFTVAAFCGTECRGIGKYVDGVIFMNVHGEGNENITFQAMHNEKEYLVDIQESLTFTEDVVGSYRAPFALHLGSEYNSVQELYSQFAVWPTMATTEITVSLGGMTIDHLTLTSIDGKTTYSASPGAAQSTVNVTNLPAGVYIVSAKSGNEYFYKKIMKVN